MQTRIRFPYGNQYGWGVEHRRKSKHVLDVFAEKGAFTVMLRMTDAQFLLAYDSLLPQTRACIDGRYPCGAGGWIYYRVTAQEELDDILRLARTKMQGK